MMDISRRKLLRLVPASVGAIALGAASWLEKRQPAKPFIYHKSAFGETHVFPGGLSYVDRAFTRQYERDVHLIFNGSYPAAVSLE